jgi:RHS repeat-associated protein
LPQYLDSIDSDVFLFSEAEDLVPAFRKKNDGSFEVDSDGEYILHEKDSPDGLFVVRYYRPRIEGLFARIERWVHKDTGEIRWRIITKENQTTLFGWTKNARIADPDNANKIFEWLPEFVFDDKGNCTHYLYRKEDDAGFDRSLLYQRNRMSGGVITYTNTYLEKVLYGNKTPYKKMGDAFPAPNDYLFSTLFDYGEYNPVSPYNKTGNWTFRPDAFSDYRAGFEIRTTRLCKRVLLFHHFTNAGEYDGLIRSTDFTYDTGIEEDFTFLKSITQQGYIKKQDGSYSSRSFPAMEFTYQRHDWNKEVRSIDAADIIHAPAGLDGQQYQFTDLFNEGLSGILTEQANGWYYKHNLGNGEFEQARLISPRPSFSGLGTQLQLTDLDADGGKQLVGYDTMPRGYFELNDDKEWVGFRSFNTMPGINFNDPNTRMLDLNGDGKAEVVISEENAFTWYPSEGRGGFSSARKTSKPFDEEAGPNIIFADSKQSIFLADMSGDGLTDIVRIRNGEVSYWPNLGYGKFGTRVALENSPVFDHPDAFNASFIQLADIDGSGTSDIIYLGKNKFTCWKNLSGNRFGITPFEIEMFPEIHGLANVSVVDLLGNGIACIAWSSPLAKDAYAPLRYIDLMNSRKPHIMIAYKNNMGKEVSLEYTPSSKYYIEDKKAGRPWVTQLHFPVHCISKTITEDKISGSRFVSEYKYHHGYYDHPEREFRGFGMVEQTDAESFEHWGKDNALNILDETLQQEPVISKTWYHTGAFLGKDKILNQFKEDYWYEEMNRQGFPVVHHETVLTDARMIVAPGLDPSLPDHLSGNEWHEALRACKGMGLRSEIFAKDAAKSGNTIPARIKELTPFSVVTNSCMIELLQPKGRNKHAVFVVKESEAITYGYERVHDDPRISHTINTRLDEYGNILESAAIVYPRAVPDITLPAATQQEQNKTVIIYTQNDFTNDIADDILYPDVYRHPMPSEVKTFNLKGVSKTTTFYKPGDFNDILSDTNSTTAGYHELNKPLIAGKAQRRLIEHIRSLYYRNNFTGALNLHQLESLAIPFESYQLAYTPALITDIFGAKVNAGLLTEGKFTNSEGDNNWWVSSGTTQFIEGAETNADAQNRFYTPVSYTDPYGATTHVKYYSDYFLFIEETRDAIGNTVRAEKFNFRLLSPQRMKDINANLSEAIADELGLVKAIAIYGKGNEADDLTGITEVTELVERNQAAAFFATPLTASGVTDSVAMITAARQLLQHATACFVYDFEVYKNTGKPAVVASVTREEHFQKNNNSPVQLSFEYSNGLGNMVMKKIQAEPGTAKKVTVNTDNSYFVSIVDTTVPGPALLRWIGNGKTILNNKGNVVKQYEAYFSVNHYYEDFEELVETGVTPKMYYDATSRLVKTVMPDESFSKTEFDSWKQTVYDANDTILDSPWYSNRTNRLIDAQLLAEDKNPGREKLAADKAAKHANTPQTYHFDTLGRPVLSVEHNKNMQTDADEFYYSRLQLDAESNLRTVTDDRGNAVMEYKYDMLGNPVYQKSMDAGQRWLLLNILNKPLRTWDERNHEFRYFYDNLQRPTHNTILGGDGDVVLDNIFDRIIYGESLLLPDRSNETAIQASNVLGQAIQHYDTGGLIDTPVYDFKGQAIAVTRRLFKKYKETAHWTDANLLADLEAQLFTFVTDTDALGRITRQTAPDGSIITPLYNEAGLLNNETVLHSGDTVPSTYIKNIDYNEKGQRDKIVYGNDVSTLFYYDKETFRLKRLQTFPSGSGGGLQDWNYTFDPMGNITHIEDKINPVTFFQNQLIAGIAEYTYDALYRLTEAKGRENNIALGFDNKDNWNDAPFMQAINPGDPVAMRNYIQTYQYDSVGNIRQMKHQSTGNDWTRDYTYENNNNRLRTTAVGSETYNYTYHPQHGFMTVLPHLEETGWTFKEELLKTIRQRRLDGGTAETTWYQYDGAGQRIRKITENQAAPAAVPTLKDERIYIAGYELYKKHSGGDAGLERISLSLMDQGHRFVMIETRNDIDDGTEKQLIRYQLHNHVGSAALELDHLARVISYEEYHPFGTTAFQAKNTLIRSAAKRYRYTGMERDEETGLSCHGARYYLAWLGRWMSCDPSGIEDGLNDYSYCKSNPITNNDTNGKQSADQTRFRELYNERAAADRGTAHASTLIHAFTDPKISGTSVKDRFLSILTLTSGSIFPNGPTGHFDPYTIRQIGTDGPTVNGDTGFRRELKDSIRYRKNAKNDDYIMHSLSSDQIGHFLTAADIGYTLKERSNYIAAQRQADAAYRRDNPFMSFIRDALDTTTSDMAVQYDFEAFQYQSAMIGHEMIADREISVTGTISTAAAPLVASATDIKNFLSGRLDQIAINDSQRGNSYQDILLTWVGYKFGEHIADGTFSTNQEASRWLEMMLTDQDLSKVAPTDPFYADAQQMQALLQQFRQTQQRIHPGDKNP